MSKMAGNKIVRSLLVLCVMMQVVAMTPHHHHEGSEDVCLNYFHLSHDHDAEAGDDCCGSCCGDDHGHDNDPFTACNTHNLVITQPEKERPEAEVVADSIPDDCHCGYCDTAGDFGVAGHSASEPTAELSVQPYVVPHLIEYIATALSPRAPDFIA